MPTCGEQVGNNSNPAHNHTTYPCLLVQGHPGPHVATEIDRSVRERKSWEVAQVGTAPSGDAPIPVGSQESNQLEHLLMHGGGQVPPGAMERLTMQPPKAGVPFDSGPEALWSILGLLFEVSEDQQGVVDLTLSGCGLVSYGGMLYFAQSDYDPPKAAFARLATQVIEQHPELIPHLIQVQVVTLTATSDLTDMLRTLG